MLSSHTALIQKLLNTTLNYKNIVIEKLSFIDYSNQTFYANFPFNKQLSIHNTSTLDKFGYGRYIGNFFDIIVRLESGNPMNLRIFYSIEKNNEDENTVQEKKQEVINILGKERRYFKKGRVTYIEYEGQFISLTEAKRLEKKNNGKD